MSIRTETNAFPYITLSSSGCDQKSQSVRLLHEDALIMQNMGR